MSCKNVCRECDNKVYSTAVNFDSATNALLVNIPEGEYRNNCTYCLIVIQPIPASTTINSQVFITIEGDVTRYPLVNCDCSPISACSLRTRTRYKTVVKTDAVSGVFKFQGKLCFCNAEVLRSLPAPTVAPASVTTLRSKTTKKEVAE